MIYVLASTGCVASDIDRSDPCAGFRHADIAQLIVEHEAPSDWAWTPIQGHSPIDDHWTSGCATSIDEHILESELATGLPVISSSIHQLFYEVLLKTGPDQIFQRLRAIRCDYFENETLVRGPFTDESALVELTDLLDYRRPQAAAPGLSALTFVRRPTCDASGCDVLRCVAEHQIADGCLRVRLFSTTDRLNFTGRVNWGVPFDSARFGHDLAPDACPSGNPTLLGTPVPPTSTLAQ